jgi:hypothetical protein
MITAASASAWDAKPAAKVSYPKGRKNKNQVKQCNSPAGWYLRSCFLDGWIEAIFITTASKTEDAYYNPLVRALADDTAQPVKDIGLLGAFYQRVSLTNTAPLMNYRKGNAGEYQRKAFIRAVDEGEDSPEDRLAALKVIQAFLEEKRNNQFKAKVYIEVPSNEEPKKVDNFLEYKEIVKIIKSLFDNVDADWAKNNLESAMCFFTAGHIPFAAHADLGFPLELVQARATSMFTAVPPQQTPVKEEHAVVVSPGGSVNDTNVPADNGLSKDDTSVPAGKIIEGLPTTGPTPPDAPSTVVHPPSTQVAPASEALATEPQATESSTTEASTTEATSKKRGASTTEATSKRRGRKD